MLLKSGAYIGCFIIIKEDDEGGGKAAFDSHFRFSNAISSAWTAANEVLAISQGPQSHTAADKVLTVSQMAADKVRTVPPVVYLAAYLNRDMSAMLTVEGGDSQSGRIQMKSSEWYFDVLHA